MLIYNTKEMETKYMQTDEVVVEIHSLIPVEEMLERLRNGEEISEDVASIAAFAINDAKVVTQAEYVEHGEQEAGSLGYNNVLESEQLENLEEAAEDHDRAKLLQAYEAFQFNRPWRHYDFHPVELSRDQLITQLYAALGIMPTIKNIPDKTLAELKKMSNSGDRLYWNFAPVAHNNKLPSRADIEFYETLGDYEKRIINESGVHPMKMLDIARGIKEGKGDSGRILTIQDEQRAHINGTETVIALAKTPGITLNRRISGYNTEEDLAFNMWMNTDLPNAKFAEEMIKLENAINAKLFVEAGVLDSSRPESLSSISAHFNQKLAECGENAEMEAKILKQEENAKAGYFAKLMFEARVFPQNLLDAYSENSNTTLFADNLLAYYRRVYEEEFLPAHTTTQQNAEGQDEVLPNYDEAAIRDYVNSAYKTPMPKCIQKAEEVFKELFRGHAPRVLFEYMYGQFFARGISPHDATEAQIREIAGAFDQKNVSKVAKYKNLVLFALADRLHFNEVKIEHLEAIATFIKPEDLRQVFGKGFVEWYKANKDTNLSNLVEMLSMYNQISRFDPSKTAKDHIMKIQNAKGVADCEQMERKHHYRFEDNEIAIRGRHVMAQDGKMKMYMLPVDDYRNFTVGYDTHCCQHYGNAGETCVWKLTTDPFAACVVVERDGKILAQGFVWTDEVQDTLVFDNVEFAEDRKVGQFNNLFAAWCRAMPYKNIHVGTGYNQGMHSWGKKIPFSAKIPTTLSDSHIYSDYHNDARALKINGQMQIQERTPVKVTTKPDEPTRWDDLARPETSFLLNDCHSSIESRIAFARNFLHEQTPEIQMEAVRRNPYAIKYIESPTEEVQREVVQRDHKLATLIQNPCYAVQKILVDLNPAYIRSIQNPDEEMARKAVKANGLLLGDIANPSDVVKMLAVEQNGYAIKFIENQTEELQMAAVRTSPKVVSQLRNASLKVQKAAVDASPAVVSLIDRPSEEIQLYAVAKDPYVINSIDAPSYSAVKKAVETNGLLVRNFQYTYPHLRLTALKQNGFAIRVIKNPTDEEYVEAVRQNRAVANLIRDPEIKANVLAIVDGRAQIHDTDYDREDV